MSDAVAIVPELPFRQQIIELALHISRSSPSPNDQAAVREFVGNFEAQTKPEEGQQDVSEEKKRRIVRSLVGKVVDFRGALDGAKETDVEPCHLLLQHLLSSNFDVESPEYAERLKSVVESVQRGGEAASQAGRSGRADAASRILNNTYNSLPSSSPLRPTALLALLSLLKRSGELASLPLSSSFLSASLPQWHIPQSEKGEFLASASRLYEGSDPSMALDLLLLAVKEEGDETVVERAILLAVADQKRYSIQDVLNAQNTKKALTGKAGELVGLFTDVDEVEAVGKGKEWADASGPYLEGISIPGLTPDAVLRKIRLIALATLCARSSSKQLSYSEVASALQIDEREVEAWAIDAIRADLIKARLSQPSSLIRIISVSSAGTRRFASAEWALLEQRLQDWKKVVSEARTVIEEAEGVAAQGPITHQRRAPGPRRQPDGEQQREEVTA